MERNHNTAPGVLAHTYIGRVPRHLDDMLVLWAQRKFTNSGSVGCGRSVGSFFLWQVNQPCLFTGKIIQRKMFDQRLPQWEPYDARVSRTVLRAARGEITWPTYLCQGFDVKFQFIDAEKDSFSVKLMCQVFKVSRPGYYAWKSRSVSDRVLRDEALTKQIKASHELSRGTYGSPRVHADLEAAGECVGVNRVARLMRQSGIVVKPRRGFRCATIQRDPAHKVVPNELDRDFTATRFNQKWVTDTTFIGTGEGWLYLGLLWICITEKWWVVPWGQTTIPL